MERFNVIDILTKELDNKKHIQGVIRKMTNKEYACEYLPDVIIDFVEKYIEFNLDSPYEMLSLSYSTIEDFYYNDEKDKKYYDFLDTNDERIKIEVANKIVAMINKRNKIDNTIYDYIENFLKDKIISNSFEYNDTIKKFLFYIVLLYYDEYLIYESGLCNIDLKNDKHNFLFSKNNAPKELIANEIINVMNSNKEYILNLNNDDITYENIQLNLNLFENKGYRYFER